MADNNRSTGTSDSVASKNQYTNENDNRTVLLVKKVKAKLTDHFKDRKTITESDVAFATFDAKREQNSFEDKVDGIRESIIGNNTNLNSVFDISAAYGNDKKDISRIYDEEVKRYEKDSTSYPKRRYAENSLDNIISPLKELNKGKTEKNLEYLFVKIQEIRSKNVLRADRMFYAEVQEFVRNSKPYTIEEAHDQVQAICLMHFRPKSNRDCTDFIEKCRTFESAHSYLQALAKQNSNKRREASSTRTGSPRSGDGNSQSLHNSDHISRDSMSASNNYSANQGRKNELSTSMKEARRQSGNK